MSMNNNEVLFMAKEIEDIKRIMNNISQLNG